MDVMRTKVLATASAVGGQQGGADQVNKVMTDFMAYLIPELRHQRETFAAQARKVIDALQGYVILAAPSGQQSNMLVEARAKSRRRGRSKHR